MQDTHKLIFLILYKYKANVQFDVSHSESLSSGFFLINKSKIGT